MEQLVSAAQDGSFGALLRAFRQRACLSQERLAARAELSERTVRNLEGGRVLSPRHDTVSLLADALELGEPERESWLAAARGANWRAGPATAGADSPAQLPGHLTVAVVTCDGPDASGRAITCLIHKAGEIVLAVHCVEVAAARYPVSHPGCLVVVNSPYPCDGLAARDGVRRITSDKLGPAK